MRFWLGARGYWQLPRSRGAWTLTVSLVAVVFVSLAITYSINLWHRNFFDAVEARNAEVALRQAILFPLLVGIYLVLCVFAMWARMTMQRNWRAWMNAHLVSRWLTKARFYRLELVGGDHKNPEHRINDDTRIATEMPVDFVTGFLTAALSAVTFVAVLWTIGGALTIDTTVGAITIPGFLVIAAIAYALVANGVMLGVAFRFITTTERKNQAEAEHRYALARMRENAEGIALIGGEDAERRQLEGLFGNVVGHWRDLMRQHMRAVIVSQGSAQLCGVVPILLCTPRYLDGSMTLGQVMQAASAFVIVQGALSWFMENYTRLGEWTASARRVASLLVALDAAEQSEGNKAQGIRRRTSPGGALQLRNVRVAVEHGATIVDGASTSITPGERVLVVGESGTGKSSLIRAIAGCWPWGGGEVVSPELGRMRVVPQRSYVPPGTLRSALAYPSAPNRCDTGELERVLATVGLGRLVAQLDVAAPWERILSEGEKQRLAIARVVLQRPDLIILDEATSALHLAGQAEVMGALARELPQATILSVGHRPELEAFHARKLVMARTPTGAKIVEDVSIAPKRPIPLQDYVRKPAPRVHGPRVLR
ncbi:MAG: ABC transporter ATP-binding protein/permease [Xanthobacteraceae bacterium]